MRTIIVLLLATAVFAVSSEDVMNTIKKVNNHYNPRLTKPSSEEPY